MPIAHFHLIDPTPEQQREVLVRGTQAYAEAFESPVDRIRIFIHTYAPTAAAVGGVPVAEGAPPAPFFNCLAMGGRPIEQQQRAIVAMTDMLEEVLGVDRSIIRGLVTEVNPDTWGIAGEPASKVRAAEIAARAAES